MAERRQALMQAVWSATALGWTAKNYPDSSIHEGVQRGRCSKDQAKRQAPVSEGALQSQPDTADEQPSVLRPRRLHFNAALTTPGSDSLPCTGHESNPSLPAGARVQRTRPTAYPSRPPAQAMNPSLEAGAVKTQADMTLGHKTSEDEQEEGETVDDMDLDPVVTVDYF